MTDLEFRLPDPEMARDGWFWDSLHCPRPLPALAAEVMQSVMGSGGPQGVIVNGYAYMRLGPMFPTAEVDPPPVSDALTIWRDHCLPRIRAIVEAVRSAPYGEMDAGELAKSLPGLARETGKAFAYTMQPLPFLMGPLMAFLTFCEDRFGVEGEMIALTVLQGEANDSSAAGAGLSTLAEQAAALPELARALQEGRFEDVPRVEGGAEFTASLHHYLDDYGSGTHTWWEVHKPTWREQPEIPLRIVASILGGGGSPAASQETARQASAAALAAAEARLIPDQLARFRQLATDARPYVPVIEDRARWQLASVGAIRPAVLTLGEKLAASGVIEARDDVFLYTSKELAEIAGGVLPAKREASARRAMLALWADAVPPRLLGTPPPEMPAGPGGLMAKVFGLAPAPAQRDPGVLRGIGACGGTHTGTARIILDLEDSERLQPGDVLVCPFTAPPWTPLFGIAGAVVTDAGGVLSHSAIAAREYAIPCVVGTQRATRTIPNGTLVTVDGTAGTVTIGG